MARITNPRQQYRAINPRQRYNCSCWRQFAIGAMTHSVIGAETVRHGLQIRASIGDVLAGANLQLVL